jgi:hypothetical protein
MRLPSKTTMRTRAVSIWDATKRLAGDFTRSLQAWATYYRTRMPLFFKKYLGFLIFISVYITIFEIISSVLFPEWMRLMNVYIGVTLLVLVPIGLLVILFVVSLRPRTREEFDEYIGFGKPAIRKRMDNVETRLGNVEGRLGNIETTLKNIEDKLDKHIQDKHHNQE